VTLLQDMLHRQSQASVKRQDALASRRRGIVDIGSNSIRLVVYDGPERSPFLLFNEKVSAGLGAGLSETGRIDDTAMERGITALVRFSCLAAEMEVEELSCIATAAVREAENGSEFVARAKRDAAMDIEIFTGEQEAQAAGYGVLSAIPDADGIVADLGGGSLELARVRDGDVYETVSLPLGVLRLPAIRERGKDALPKYMAKALKQSGWDVGESGLPLYLVGGSWRALAHLDMQLSHFPLPIIHNYRMNIDRAAYLVRVTAQMSKSSLKKVPAIPSSRAATLRHASALLAALVRQLSSSELVVSAHGLREGILFSQLGRDARSLDPLLVAAEAEGEAQGRFKGHGALIDRWIEPLFSSDPESWARIRRAACLLGDVGWRANPDFRAERGLEIALHGNWVGINAFERAMLAQALYSNFGGGAAIAPGLHAIAEETALARAVQWGLAIRLAQRLSGGVAPPLENARLALDDTGAIELMLPHSHACLRGETVNRRLKHLGQAMGAEWNVRLAD